MRSTERTEGSLLEFDMISVILTVVTAAAVTVSAFGYASDWSLLAWVAPLGVLLGAAMTALAVARFGTFVLAVLVIRTSLDAFKLGDSATVPDPAAFMGILFLGMGAFWLIAESRHPDSVPFSPLSRAAVAFAGVAFLGVVISPSIAESLVEWSRLASVCMMLLVVEKLTRKPPFRMRLLLSIALAVLAPLTVAAWQMATDRNLFDAGGFERVRGTFTHSNPLAAFLAILVVMAFAILTHHTDRRMRTAAVLIMVLSGVGLYFTYTRAAWLGALLGLFVVTWSLGRKPALIFAGTALVALLLVPGVGQRFSDLTEADTSRGEPSNSLTWRVGYWTEAVELTRGGSQITGIGLKQVAAQSSEGKQPHNDILRAYVEMGVLGLVAYVWLLWQFLATARRGLRLVHQRRGPLVDAILVGYAGVASCYVLMSLVANLMSQVVVGLYFVAIAGLAVGVMSTEEEADAEVAADLAAAKG